MIFSPFPRNLSTTLILLKMTGGTPEVQSDKSLTLLTFDIWFFTFDIWHMTFYILHSTNAQLVKRVNEFEKYKKWEKVDPCFSFNKPTKQEI